MDMKDGGSAFPMLEAWKENADLYCPDRGMTLRDYFAGQALAGLCSDWLNMPDAVTLPEGVSRAEAVAECAYQIADAMIAERERP